MKASMYGIMTYVTPQDLPRGWPVPPGQYDRDIGLRNFSEAIEQLEFADELGFDWVSFSEHHYSNVSVAPHPTVIAAALADRIKRAKIAILGHVLPLNNPVRVAEELAMLDNLTGGRLIVGLLRGTPNEYQVYTVNPAATREMALESMELIVKAWTEPQPFSWEGRYYQYRTVSVWPRSLQAPHPPVYVLGTSRESSEFAARHHFGSAVSFDNFEYSAHPIATYREQCLDHGWEPTPDEILFRGTCYVGETDEKAAADTAAFWTRGGGINLAMKPTIAEAVGSVDPHPRSPSTGYGSRDRRPQFNFIGSPATVVEQLRQCREQVGAGVVDLWFQGPDLAHKKVMHSVELFGKEVLPAIRDF